MFRNISCDVNVCKQEKKKQKHVLTTYYGITLVKYMTVQFSLIKSIDFADSFFPIKFVYIGLDYIKQIQPSLNASRRMLYLQKHTVLFKVIKIVL